MTLAQSLPRFGLFFYVELLRFNTSVTQDEAGISVPEANTPNMQKLEASPVESILAVQPSISISKRSELTPLFSGKQETGIHTSDSQTEIGISPSASRPEVNTPQLQKQENYPQTVAQIQAPPGATPQLPTVLENLDHTEPLGVVQPLIQRS